MTPKRKVYQFAQGCQELLMELFRLEGGQSAFNKSCEDFHEVRDDKDDASLLDFFTKNVGIARYLQSKRGDLVVLASHFDSQRSRHKGGDRAAQALFKPSPVKGEGDTGKKRARVNTSRRPCSAPTLFGPGEEGETDDIGAAAGRFLLRGSLVPDVERVLPAPVPAVFNGSARSAKRLKH